MYNTHKYIIDILSVTSLSQTLKFFPTFTNCRVTTTLLRLFFARLTFFLSNIFLVSFFHQWQTQVMHRGTSFARPLLCVAVFVYLAISIQLTFDEWCTHTNTHTPIHANTHTYGLQIGASGDPANNLIKIESKGGEAEQEEKEIARHWMEWVCEMSWKIYYIRVYSMYAAHHDDAGLKFLYNTCHGCHRCCCCRGKCAACFTYSQNDVPERI